MRKKGLGGRHATVLLGAYVLGGLRGREEARVRTHLTRCAPCRAEYEDLAEIPALLGMITAEDAADAGSLTGQVLGKDAAHRR
jgi:predicted anti-sigma-YlaC factor YlaD